MCHALCKVPKNTTNVSQICLCPARDRESHGVSLGEVLGFDYHVRPLDLAQTHSQHASLTDKEGEVARVSQKGPHHLDWKSAPSTGPRRLHELAKHGGLELTRLDWKLLIPSNPQSLHLQNEEPQLVSLGRLTGISVNCLVQYLVHNRCSKIMGVFPL
ncbi:hypothetical protein HJG60_007789 [Phyllostomus discolor]|uniref:Uncharacterized protein n=1 Tax=Phyllostomus discolor TaxID=89673 RepID=A0A834EV38_9CHIR|nr:hypothetical protein HJG60_007789 [Phyllostomus discolor]